MCGVGGGGGGGGGGGVRGYTLYGLVSMMTSVSWRIFLTGLSSEIQGFTYVISSEP